MNDVLFPIARNSSVPSLDIINLSATFIVEVEAPCKIILPSPRLIEACVEDNSKLLASNSKFSISNDTSCPETSICEEVISNLLPLNFNASVVSPT